MSTVPRTSRLDLAAAGLAPLLATIALVLIAVALIAVGVAKFPPLSEQVEHVGPNGASAQLLDLATGGVIATPWGAWLVGLLQVALGIGLLVPRARSLASLACLFTAVAIVVGAVFHWQSLSSGALPSATGICLVFVVLILVSGAALGCRSAALRTGSAR